MEYSVKVSNIMINDSYISKVRLFFNSLFGVIVIPPNFGGGECNLPPFIFFYFFLTKGF